MVGKWHRRFVQDRVEGFNDDYRPGRAHILSDSLMSKVIERTLNTTLRDATHWSIRSMAAETGLSHTTICWIWAAFSRTACRLSSPLFDDKV